MVKLTYWVVFICRISADLSTKSSSRVPIWLKQKLCKKSQIKNFVPLEIPVIAKKFNQTRKSTRRRNMNLLPTMLGLLLLTGTLLSPYSDCSFENPWSWPWSVKNYYVHKINIFFKLTQVPVVAAIVAGPCFLVIQPIPSSQRTFFGAVEKNPGGHLPLHFLESPLFFFCRDLHFHLMPPSAARFLSWFCFPAHQFGPLKLYL